MPNPRATTDACKRNLANARLSAANGCRNVNPKIIPAHKAMGGEINPVALNISSTKKMVFVFMRYQERLAATVRRNCLVQIVCCKWLVANRLPPLSLDFARLGSQRRSVIECCQTHLEASHNTWTWAAQMGRPTRLHRA